MKPYRKPSDISQEEWNTIYDVITNENGEKVQKFLSQFDSEDELMEHLKDIEQKASPYTPITDIGKNILSQLALYKISPLAKGILNKYQHKNLTLLKNVGDAREAFDRKNMQPLIKGYKAILQEHFKKLHQKAKINIPKSTRELLQNSPTSEVNR